MIRRLSLKEQVAISAGGGGMVNQGLIAGGPLGGKKKKLPESHKPSGSRWKVVLDAKISPEMAEILKRFLRFCQKKLVIKHPPVIYLLSRRVPGMTTGGYNPSDNTILALSQHRLFLDVLKTLAHELTHRMQDERGDFSKLKPRVDENDNSDLNTDYENEAYINSGNYVKEFCRLYRGQEKERLYSLHESLQVEAPKPEASSEDPFGQYLFGQERNLPSSRKPETDSDEENALSYDLNAHYTGGMWRLKPWIDKLVDLDKAGKYQPVLHVPEKYSKAWRVMTFSKSELEGILQRKLTEEELARYPKPKVFLENNVVIPPLKDRAHASWTVSPSVFKKIQSDWGHLAYGVLDKYIVFCQASIKANTFLLNPDVLQKTPLPDVYAYQKEILSVGPVNCEKIWFAKLETDSSQAKAEYMNTRDSENAALKQVIAGNRRKAS